VFEQEITTDQQAKTQLLLPMLFMNSGTMTGVADDCSGVYEETDD
jgi:hypothetical protein